MDFAKAFDKVPHKKLWLHSPMITSYTTRSLRKKMQLNILASLYTIRCLGTNMQQQQQRFYSNSPWISYIITCLQFLGKLGRALRITKGLDNRRARRWDWFLYLVCTYIPNRTGEYVGSLKGRLPFKTTVTNRGCILSIVITIRCIDSPKLKVRQVNPSRRRDCANSGIWGILCF